MLHEKLLWDEGCSMLFQSSFPQDKGESLFSFSLLEQKKFNALHVESIHYGSIKGERGRLKCS